jgi:hypothetical protein
MGNKGAASGQLHFNGTSKKMEYVLDPSLSGSFEVRENRT